MNISINRAVVSIAFRHLKHRALTYSTLPIAIVNRNPHGPPISRYLSHKVMTHAKESLERRGLCYVWRRLPSCLVMLSSSPLIQCRISATFFHHHHGRRNGLTRQNPILHASSALTCRTCRTLCHDMVKNKNPWECSCDFAFPWIATLPPLVVLDLVSAAGEADFRLNVTYPSRIGKFTCTCIHDSRQAW